MANLSMMFQIPSLTAEDTRKYMQHVHKVRHTPGGDNIVEVHVEHLASERNPTPNWAAMDEIAPYAPGGLKRSMNNLFVGTRIIDNPTGGSRYREGVTSAAYRKEQIDRSEELARKFNERYRDKIAWWHWYIDYEAVLNWWTDPDVANGYAQLLGDWIKMYHSVRPNTSILFQPAYWHPTIPTAMPQIVRSVFTKARDIGRQAGHSKGVNWIGIQDMQGRDWVGSTVADTSRWIRMFESTGMFSAVWPLGELFEHRTDYYGVGDAEDWRTRNIEYERLGHRHQWVFEARYWYQMEQKLMRPGEEPDPVTPIIRRYANEGLYLPGHPDFEAVRAIVERSHPGSGASMVEARLVSTHQS